MGKRSLNYKDPKIGAWGNGENVGHTAYFVNIQKVNNGEPTSSQIKPKKNRDMHPREDPPAQAHLVFIERTRNINSNTNNNGLSLRHSNF